MEGERSILYVGRMTLVQKISGCLIPAALMALGGLAATPASAQSIVSTGESFVDVSFVSGRPAEGGARMAGLVLELAPGWKTYWRSPGGAGVPPVFDWSASENVAEAEVLWPRPHFFESFGFETLGYTEAVVFPVRLAPADPARPMAVRLDLQVGVCRDLCVLEETTVSAEIAPDAPAEGAGLVAMAETAVPRPASEAGLAEARCRVTGAGAERGLEATLVFDRALVDPAVVVEGPEFAVIEDVKTVAGPDSGRLTVTAALSLLDGKTWIGRSDLRMTVLAEDFAADVKGCTAPAG